MKIISNAKLLSEAIQWSTRGMDMKNDNSFVVLDVEKSGKVTFSHTGESTYMLSPLAVSSVHENNDDMRIPLSGQYLSRMVSVLKRINSDVELSYDQDSDATVSVKSQDGTISLSVPVFDSSAPKKPKTTVLGEVDGVEFFDYLHRLSKICDSANAGISGAIGAIDVNISAKNSMITMMATDRYVMSVVGVPFSPDADLESSSFNDKHFLVPQQAVSLVSQPKLSDSDVTLLTETTGSKFGYEFSNGSVALFALKDSEPVPYTSAVKNANSRLSSQCTVDTTALKNAVESVLSLSWEDNNALISIGKDTVTAYDSHKKNVFTMDSADFEGEGTILKFKRDIIIDSFSPIKYPRIKLMWDGKNHNSMVLYMKPVNESNVEIENVVVYSFGKSQKKLED